MWIEREVKEGLSSAQRRPEDRELRFFSVTARLKTTFEHICHSCLRTTDQGIKSRHSTLVNIISSGDKVRIEKGQD